MLQSWWPEVISLLPLELTGIRLRVSTAGKYWHAKVYYPQRCSLPAGSFGPFLFITWFLGPPWVHTPVFESTYFTFPFRFQNNATFYIEKMACQKVVKVDSKSLVISLLKWVHTYFWNCCHLLWLKADSHMSHFTARLHAAYSWWSTLITDF